MINLLIDQLNNTRWDARSRQGQLSSKATYILTGKKGTRAQDDLAVAYAMVDWWREVFLRRTTPEYVQFKELIRSLGFNY
jgi:hypothetical protein